MYCNLRPPWSFKSDDRCPLKVTASPLKVMASPLKVMASPLKVMAGPLKVTVGPLNVKTGWEHLLSLSKDQGGPYNTVHYYTLQGNGTLFEEEKNTYIFGISAKIL